MGSELVPSSHPVYKTGEFHWINDASLSAMGYRGPFSGLVIQLPVSAPEAQQHHWELQGYDKPGRRWWIEHLCCFTSDLPEFVQVSELWPEIDEHDEMTGC